MFDVSPHDGAEDDRTQFVASRFDLHDVITGFLRFLMLFEFKA